MALNQGIPINKPPMPPATANTIPPITWSAPAIIERMPAVVGFHVRSIFYPSLVFLRIKI
jgi:glutamate mutase epsilon subunit